MMNLADIDVTTSGIRFSVQPTFRFGSQRTLSDATCFISNQTLENLAEHRRCNGHLPEEIFRQLESEITGVAKRLVLAGINEKPLVVRYGNFTIVDH
jgi:hypothetical protein